MANAGTKLWLGNQEALSGDYHILQQIAFPAEMSGTQSASARDISPALSVKHTIAISPQIRRLTPVECERLQGFPDHYTDINWRGKGYAPDGPRYKAMGNSMAVPVMRWIGERIQMVETIQ